MLALACFNVSLFDKSPSRDSRICAFSVGAVFAALAGWGRTAGSTAVVSCAVRGPLCRCEPTCRAGAKRISRVPASGASVGGREALDGPEAVSARCSGVALGAHSLPERPEIALELTRALLAARQFTQAEQMARNLLAVNPRSEPAQFLLAYSYFMQERFPEAGNTLQKLLAQNNRNPEAHKLLGLTLFFYKEYVMAERALIIALRSRPDDQEALYFLGRVYYTQNSFRPAVAAFQRLLALNPQSYKGYDNLGLCYQALGKIDEAIAAFKKAQEIARAADPAYDWPYANLADMLIKENRPEEALAQAQEAVRINPRSARNHYLLGKALARGTDLGNSLTHLHQAAKLDPNYAEPHYLLGQPIRSSANVTKLSASLRSSKKSASGRRPNRNELTLAAAQA